MARLSLATLDQLPNEIRQPSYERRRLKPRLAHIGVGAFHRAHQAVYTEQANEIADARLGVVGVSLRSAAAETALAPQDGLYTVGTRDGAAESVRVVANMLGMITAPSDPAAAAAVLADPGLLAVTLTITEKGYWLDPATGALIADKGDVAADLAAPDAPRSAIGYLYNALKARHEAGLPPFTVVSCDNLPENGARVRAAIVQYAERLDPALAKWIAEDGAFPQTMVDRIVPKTTDDDLAAVEMRLGVRDEAYVKAEPFMQWVIEDRFAGPRLPWDAGGAMIVDAVGPYETAKLRLLNGPHSAIAYLGYLAGCEYVHDVMADPGLSGFVETLMDTDILQSVAEPKGMPLPAYARDLRARFRNAALQHRTHQIAMDGSQKLPQRLLNTVRDALAAGRSVDRLALPIAAWMRYAAGRDEAGAPIEVLDPLHERFATIADKAGGNADALRDGFLGLKEVFGDDLPAAAPFREALSTQLNALFEKGARQAAADAR
ncbi:MAG: mannitol dehydrogenase family protein [Parvularculaceae bacterium]